MLINLLILSVLWVYLINIQIGMEVDINEPNSKFFNVFLRMMQVGGQVALAYWAVRFHEY